MKVVFLILFMVLGIWDLCSFMDENLPKWMRTAELFCFVTMMILFWERLLG